MFKGHTKIELTDVNTGEVQTVEDDNMVTNALKYILETGICGKNVMSGFSEASRLNMWKQYLGGLLLFDSALEENVENIIAPGGVTMVGNGAYNIANSTDLTELGTYNTNESVETDPGNIKFVWDYSTDQANGTIRCACLTSTQGGHIGYGNEKSGKYVKNNYLAGGSYFELGWTNSIMQSTYGILLYFNPEESIAYVVDRYSVYYSGSDKHYSVTGNIIVNKYQVRANEISLFASSDVTLLETINIKVPDDVMAVATTSNSVNIADDGLYIATRTSANANQKIGILKLKTDLTLTGYVFTAPEYMSFNPILIINNYIIYYNNSASLFKKVNIFDSTDIVELESKSTICTDGFSAILITENVAFISIYSSSNERAAAYVFKIDTEKNIVVPLNASGRSPIPSAAATKLHGNPLAFMGNNSVCFFKPYLATINNLPEAVTKTANQTMKVTYTLTFDT